MKFMRDYKDPDEPKAAVDPNDTLALFLSLGTDCDFDDMENMMTPLDQKEDILCCC